MTYPRHELLLVYMEATYSPQPTVKRTRSIWSRQGSDVTADHMRTRRLPGRWIDEQLLVASAPVPVYSPVSRPLCAVGTTRQ